MHERVGEDVARQMPDAPDGMPFGAATLRSGGAVSGDWAGVCWTTERPIPSQEWA